MPDELFRKGDSGPMQAPFPMSWRERENFHLMGGVGPVSIGPFLVGTSVPWFEQTNLHKYCGNGFRPESISLPDRQAHFYSRRAPLVEGRIEAESLNRIDSRNLDEAR